MKNSINNNLNKQEQSSLNWETVQEDFKVKFGKDVLIESLSWISQYPPNVKAAITLVIKTL